MTTITRICLRHRRLVLLAWLILAVAGAATASSTAGRLTHTFAPPGTAGYTTNQQLLKTFGIDGNEQPSIGVLTLPPGVSMRTPAGQAIAQRVFAAANQAGHLAVADYANTHNPRLISADSRTTWALFDASPWRNVPSLRVSFRQRAANRRSKGPTAVPGDQASDLHLPGSGGGI